MKIFVVVISVLLVTALPGQASAQTTQFTYQGELTDTGSPQATYYMRFRLYDLVAAGSQIGSTIENTAVAVNGGVFTVTLDFGANAFPGADRYLEIAVKRNSGDSYTVLNPRQKIASSPYSIRTLSAQTADMALDSQKLGGIAANQYLTNASVGSAFVRNDVAQQTADFNVSGTGVVGTALGVGGAAAGGGYDLNVDGPAQFTPGGTGGAVQIGTPNGDTGMAIVGTNRADIRFNGSVLSLLTGVGTGSPAGNNGLTMSLGGLLGAGTPPDVNFRLDSLGPIRSLSPTAAHFVAQTTGGTNSWARYYMRTNNRSWFLGTSQAFNSDQLYFVDETAGKTRMVVSTAGNVGIGTAAPAARLSVVTDSVSSTGNTADFWASSIGPNASHIHYGTTGDWYIRSAAGAGKVVLQDSGGNVGIGTASPNAKLSLVGSATQDLNSRGFPKAMLHVTQDGIIFGCYNGTNGSSVTNGSASTGCGFSINHWTSGGYGIDLGFPRANRIFSVTVSDAGESFTCSNYGAEYSLPPAFPNNVNVYTFCNDDANGGTSASFMIIVY